MWKIPEFTPCFEGNTLNRDAKVVSRSVIKSLTGHDSGEKNARWLSCSTDPSWAGIILSGLSQFMGKYQEVHNLESRSLSRR